MGLSKTGQNPGPAVVAVCDKTGTLIFPSAPICATTFCLGNFYGVHKRSESLLTNAFFREDFFASNIDREPHSNGHKSNQPSSIVFCQLAHNLVSDDTIFTQLKQLDTDDSRMIRFVV